MLKPMIYALFLLAFFRGEQQNKTVFIGEIIIDERIKREIDDLTIVFKSDTLVLAGAAVKEDGSFKISTEFNAEIDIYYRAWGLQDVFAQTLKPEQKAVVYLNLKLPIQYKKKSGKAICPKCNRNDFTIPIHYGLKVITVYSKNPPPYTTFEGFGRTEIYDGGCNESVISPKYFCKMDSIKF